MKKRKSENMFNKLKSNDSDFSSLQHDPFLDIMNKNILYLTHNLDKCLSILRRMELDDKLQKHVEDFYEGQSPPGTSLPLDDMTKDIPETDE